MKDDKMRQEIQSAMDTCLSGVQPDALLVQRVLKGEKKTGKKKPVQITAFAAAFVLVAAAVVLIMGKVLPVWPDARNTAQATDGAAAAQETTADPEHYGWKEYLAEEGRPPLLPAVQAILDGTEKRFYTISAPKGSDPDSPQEQPFTVHFTVQERYADPYIAITSVHVTLTDDKNGILSLEPIGNQIDSVVAKRLGVSGELSWREASEQSQRPLYKITFRMDATKNLFPDRTYAGSHTQSRYHEDGSITVFSIAYLYGIPETDAYSVPLYLEVKPYNAGIPIYDGTSGYTSTWVSLPFRLEPITESRHYEYAGDYTASAHAAMIGSINAKAPENQLDLALNLTDVHADMTPAGLYVVAGFMAEEELDLEGTDVMLLLAPQAAAYDLGGDPLPAGLSNRMATDASDYPAVAFTRMISTDTFPESMVFELQNHSADGEETILSVPLTLSDDDAVSQAENPTDLVGQRFEVGHITFTVLEQYADPYAAMITLRAGMSEGEAGILSRYESTSTISAETADRLGVSQGITWAQAAKELDLPLYGVRALFSDPANNSNTPGLSRNEENSDGSVTIHATAFLTGDAGNLAESVKLRLMALKTDTENPSNQAERETKDITVPLHFETISETQRYTIPEGQTGSSRFRYDDWDEKIQRTVTHEVRLTFTPVAARADLTPAGVYVKVECRVAEENIERGLNFGLGMASTRILGADGDVLPGDLTYRFPMAFPMDDSAWPMVTFTHMIDADSIPEEMTFELLNRNETVLHLELKRE